MCPTSHMSLLGRVVEILLCESKPSMRLGFGLGATPLCPIWGFVWCHSSSFWLSPAHHWLLCARAEPTCSQAAKNLPACDEAGSVLDGGEGKEASIQLPLGNVG